MSPVTWRRPDQSIEVPPARRAGGTSRTLGDAMALDALSPPAEVTEEPSAADPAGAWLMLRSRLTALALLATVLFVYVVVTSLPAHPLSPGAEQQIHLKSVLPEGWGFFTISP